MEYEQLQLGLALSASLGAEGSEGTEFNPGQSRARRGRRKGRRKNLPKKLV